MTWLMTSGVLEPLLLLPRGVGGRQAAEVGPVAAHRRDPLQEDQVSRLRRDIALISLAAAQSWPEHQDLPRRYRKTYQGLLRCTPGGAFRPDPLSL